LSSNLSLSPYTSNAVFQHINIENKDFPLQTQRLCLPLPVAGFQSLDEACAGVPISIINESENGDTYQWYFDGADPATSDSIDPGNIIYEIPGYYSIKLVVNNEAGSDSIVKNITIYPEIEFSLGPDTTILLSSFLQFIMLGTYDSYLWSTGDTTSYLFVPATELQLGNNLFWLKINNGPCVASDSININVVDNSLISENNLHDILLYPNPASGSVQIKCNSEEIPSSVEFYNLMGVKVKSLHPMSNIIDVKNLEPGIYIVDITFRDYILKRRLIVL